MNKLTNLFCSLGNMVCIIALILFILTFIYYRKSFFAYLSILIIWITITLPLIKLSYKYDQFMVLVFVLLGFYLTNKIINYVTKNNTAYGRYINSAISKDSKKESLFH